MLIFVGIVGAMARHSVVSFVRCRVHIDCSRGAASLTKRVHPLRRPTVERSHSEDALPAGAGSGGHVAQGTARAGAPARSSCEPKMLSPSTRSEKAIAASMWPFGIFWPMPSTISVTPIHSRNDSASSGAPHGAAAIAAAVREVASYSASTRTIGRSSAEWYGASPSSTSGRADAATPTLPS